MIKRKSIEPSIFATAAWLLTFTSSLLFFVDYYLTARPLYSVVEIYAQYPDVGVNTTSNGYDVSIPFVIARNGPDVESFDYVLSTENTAGNRVVVREGHISVPNGEKVYVVEHVQPEKTDTHSVIVHIVHPEREIRFHIK